MKLPKIIIFDVGGTLVKGNWEDCLLGYLYLYNEILDVKEPKEDYLKFIQDMFYVIKQRESCDLEFNFRSFFNYLKDLYGLKTNKSFEEIEYNFVRSFYRPVINDYVIDILEYLKDRNIPLYVLSNSMYSTSLIERELNNIGVKDYFIQIISSGDYLVRKPSKELFKLYLKKFDMIGINKQDICYIGNDYYYDIMTPINLGMKCVHLSDKNIVHEHYLEVNSYLKLIEEFDKDE